MWKGASEQQLVTQFPVDPLDPVDPLACAKPWFHLSETLVLVEKSCFT